MTLEIFLRLMKQKLYEEQKNKQEAIENEHYALATRYQGRIDVLERLLVEVAQDEGPEDPEKRDY